MAATSSYEINVLEIKWMEGEGEKEIEIEIEIIIDLQREVRL